MKRKLATMCLLALACASTVFAAEGPVPAGIPHLDHVFVIMMENDYSSAPNTNQVLAMGAPFKPRLA